MDGCVRTMLRIQTFAGWFQRNTLKWCVQLAVVLLIALALKLGYSSASPNQLRWILAPTTLLVELVSATEFEFESHAGYMSDDHSFLIAGSCAGVNFLITSFLMLSLRKLWRVRSQGRSQNAPGLPWRFIPIAAVFAYLATLVANTVRISTALRLRHMQLDTGWLSENQFHRFQGIFIYFGFLLLLFMVNEKLGRDDVVQYPTQASHGVADLFRQSFFPLLVYYATVLGLPLANAAFRSGSVANDFWEHSLFVLLIPPLLILPLAMFLKVKGEK